MPFLSAMIRSRYYFAYYLSESINNLAGLGFDGIDADGNHKWDLINNVEIMKVTVVKAFRGHRRGLTSDYLTTT